MIKSFMQAVAPALKSAGRSLDSVGAALEVVQTADKLVPSSANLTYEGKTPSVAQDAFVAPTASVIGDVTIGTNSSVWYGAKVRGDVHTITIGNNVSIGDNSMVHVARIQGDHPTIIGDDVTVGANAVIHACTIESNAIIGHGAQVLDGAKVESNAVVAPGALVTPKKIVPSGQLWAGSPAKFLRDLTMEEIASISQNASEMACLATAHKVECGKTLEEIEEDLDNAEDAATRSPDYFARPPKDSAERDDVLGAGSPGMMFNSTLTRVPQPSSEK